MRLFSARQRTFFGVLSAALLGLFQREAHLSPTAAIFLLLFVATFVVARPEGL